MPILHKKEVTKFWLLRVCIPVVVPIHVHLEIQELQNQSKQIVQYEAGLIVRRVQKI